MSKLELYWKACNELAAEFLLQYYPIIGAHEFSWMGREIGGVLGVGDEFYGMDAVAHAMELRPSKAKLMQWYDGCVEATQRNEVFPNLKKWLKIHRNEP